MFYRKLACVLMLFTTTATGIAQETKIVIPPGFEAAEGDLLTANFPDGFRFQELASADWLSSLPASPTWLTSISLRPDANVVDPYTTPFGNVTIRVSTTDKPATELGASFADNHGDDMVVAYDQPTMIETQSILAADGVTREFDIELELATPFLYDRTKGDLLIDFMVVPPTGTVLADGLTDFVVANYADVTGLSAELPNHFSHNGPQQELATAAFAGGNVLQLTFVPEPQLGLMSLVAIWSTCCLGLRRRANK